MTNLATQRTTDVVVGHYIYNVRLRSPGLRTLSQELAHGADRSHFVPENAVGRIYWAEVERRAREQIRAVIGNDPQLAANLAQIREGKNA
jgi:hypothetical protein